MAQGSFPQSGPQDATLPDVAAAAVGGQIVRWAVDDHRVKERLLQQMPVRCEFRRQNQNLRWSSLHRLHHLCRPCTGRSSISNNVDWYYLKLVFIDQTMWTVPCDVHVNDQAMWTGKT